MFGVVSWSCDCKPVPKAHLRCTLGYVDRKEKRRTLCPLCEADITFGKDGENDTKSLKLNVHNAPKGDATEPLGDENEDSPPEDDARDSDYCM